MSDEVQREFDEMLRQQGGILDYQALERAAAHLRDNLEWPRLGGQPAGEGGNAGSGRKWSDFIYAADQYWFPKT